MSPEELEKHTVNNSLAIRELTVIAGQTSKDVDKMVSHIDKLLAINTKLENIELGIKEFEEEGKKGIRPVTLKNLLYFATVLIVSFGAWSSTKLNATEDELHTFVSTQTLKNQTHNEEQKKNIEGINANKNQITYLKGRIKK